MKRFFFQLSFYYFVLTTLCLFASKNQELFLEGNSLYKKGDIEKALSKYNAIEPKGRAVWFNMGASAYTLRKLPEALLYFKRAYKGATYNELQQIEKHILEIKRALDLPIEQTLKIRLYKHVQQYISVVSMITLQILFLLLLILLFLFFIFVTGKKRTISLILTALLIFIVIPLLVIKYKAIHQANGVIMKDKISVYTGPDEQFHEIGLLPKGIEVQIEQQRKGWMKVKLHNLVGWALADTIEKI